MNSSFLLFLQIMNITPKKSPSILRSKHTLSSNKSGLFLNSEAGFDREERITIEEEELLRNLAEFHKKVEEYEEDCKELQEDAIVTYDISESLNFITQQLDDYANSMHAWYDAASEVLLKEIPPEDSENEKVIELEDEIDDLKEELEEESKKAITENQDIDIDTYSAQIDARKHNNGLQLGILTEKLTDAEKEIHSLTEMINEELQKAQKENNNISEPQQQEQTEKEDSEDQRTSEIKAQLLEIETKMKELQNKENLLQKERESKDLEIEKLKEYLDAAKGDLTKLKEDNFGNDQQNTENNDLNRQKSQLDDEIAAIKAQIENQKYQITYSQAQMGVFEQRKENIKQNLNGVKERYALHREKVLNISDFNMTLADMESSNEAIKKRIADTESKIKVIEEKIHVTMEACNKEQKDI